MRIIIKLYKYKHNGEKTNNYSQCCPMFQWFYGVISVYSSLSSVVSCNYVISHMAEVISLDPTIWHCVFPWVLPENAVFFNFAHKSVNEWSNFFKQNPMSQALISLIIERGSLAMIVSEGFTHEFCEISYFSKCT